MGTGLERDKDLARTAIIKVQQNALAAGGPLTDEEAATIVAEETRRMRAERRAGQPARR
jgi:hypothetical protein